MELSKNFPRAKLEDTLEAILNSEKKDEFVDKFVKNFERVTKYWEVNVVLDNEYFKSKISNGGLSENINPIVEYLVSNGRIDYKINEKYLVDYYYSKNGNVKKEFIELFSNNVDIEEMKKRFGLNAIHAYILAKDKINEITQILNEENIKEIDQEKLVEELRILTLNEKLQPREVLSDTEITSLLKKMYPFSYDVSKELEDGKFIVIDDKSKRGYIIGNSNELKKLDFVIKHNDSIIVADDKISLIGNRKTYEIFQKIDIENGCLLYANDDGKWINGEYLETTKLVVLNYWENEVKREIEKVRFWGVFGVEEGYKEYDIIIFSEPRVNFLSRPIEELKAYIINKDSFQTMHIFKDELIKTILNVEDKLLIRTTKNVYMMSGSTLKKMKCKGKINNYEKCQLNKKIYLIDWKQEDANIFNNELEVKQYIRTLKKKKPRRTVTPKRGVKTKSENTQEEKTSGTEEESNITHPIKQESLEEMINKYIIKQKVWENDTYKYFIASDNEREVIIRVNKKNNSIKKYTTYKRLTEAGVYEDKIVLIGTRTNGEKKKIEIQNPGKSKPLIKFKPFN